MEFKISSNHTNKQKWCDSSEFLEQESNVTRDFKASKIATLSNDIQQEHNMLNFSLPKFETRNLQNSSFSRVTGYSSNGDVYGRMCYINGVEWPFTTSQWVELEQQALIYKYIIANQPIPSNLLTSTFCSFPPPLLTPNAYGWGPFHLGFSNNTDPEAGRCRRTDGKKWRCSRDAVLDQKYCERHMNRGRQRSRKPVEPHSGHSVSPATTNNTNSPARVLNSSAASVTSNSVALDINYSKESHSVVSNPPSAPVTSRNTGGLGFLSPTISVNAGNNTFSISEDQQRSDPSLDGVTFCTSDHTRLNSTRRTSSTYEGYDRSSILWPKIQAQPEMTQLSISIPAAPADFMSSTSSPTGLRLSREIDPLEIGLGRGKQPNLDPLSWETYIGGPLGEVLKMGSHSNSSAGSSPRAAYGKAQESSSVGPPTLLFDRNG